MKLEKIHLIPIWGSFIILVAIAILALYGMTGSEARVFVPKESVEIVREVDRQVKFEETEDDSEYIGEVTMTESGDLEFRLRAVVDGIVGHSMFTVAKGSEDYQEFLNHVQPIVPGETKPVRPWKE
jgi:hypothetical protein